MEDIEPLDANWKNRIRKANLMIIMKLSGDAVGIIAFYLWSDRCKIRQIMCFYYSCVHLHMCLTPADELAEANCGRSRRSAAVQSTVLIAILRFYYD